MAYNRRRQYQAAPVAWYPQRHAWQDREDDDLATAIAASRDTARAQGVTEHDVDRALARSKAIHEQEMRDLAEAVRQSEAAQRHQERDAEELELALALSASDDPPAHAEAQGPRWSDVNDDAASELADDVPEELWEDNASEAGSEASEGAELAMALAASMAEADERARKEQEEIQLQAALDESKATRAGAAASGACSSGSPPAEAQAEAQAPRSTVHFSLTEDDAQEEEQLDECKVDDREVGDSLEQWWCLEEGESLAKPAQSVQDIEEEWLAVDA